MPRVSAISRYVLPCARSASTSSEWEGGGSSAGSADGSSYPTGTAPVPAPPRGAAARASSRPCACARARRARDRSRRTEAPSARRRAGGARDRAAPCAHTRASRRGARRGASAERSWARAPLRSAVAVHNEAVRALAEEGAFDHVPPVAVQAGELAPIEEKEPERAFARILRAAAADEATPEEVHVAAAFRGPGGESFNSHASEQTVSSSFPSRTTQRQPLPQSSTLSQWPHRCSRIAPTRLPVVLIARFPAAPERAAPSDRARSPRGTAARSGAPHALRVAADRQRCRAR